MCGAAVDRHEAQHMRIEFGCGDAGFPLAAIRAFEKRDHAAEIVACRIGAALFTEIATVAQQAFEKAAVLAGQGRHNMFAEIASGHDGRGNAGNCQKLTDGQRTDGRCGTAREPEADRNGQDRLGGSPAPIQADH